MRRTFMLTAALTAALIATSVNAQNAMRCEVDGKVVYGDAACNTGKAGNAAKAVAPMQETAEQKAAAKSANDQIRKDNAYVDKRLDDRYKRDTARRAVVEEKTTYTKKRAVRSNTKSVADANGKTKRDIAKAKKPKKPKKKTAAKAAKKDNRTYLLAPKA